jgi:hypothetical protein
VISINIDTLPDEILLTIFDFCEDQDRYPIKEEIEEWVPLVHVCQRWRSIVFGSPRRLNLQLVCDSKTPARDTLDVWPALPLFMNGHLGSACTTEDIDNTIAVLERSDRVYQIQLTLSSSHFEKALAPMLVPFPELTVLKLESEDESILVLPHSFLGQSAPRLRLFSLDRILFPGLPNLLLSATHLVDLSLWRIPHSGHLSPEMIVTTLSTLTNLEEFTLGFQSRSRSDEARQHPPLLTRSVLPVLTSFYFRGPSEYLEDLVARIDAPQLTSLDITFSNQVVFNTREFIQFMNRTPALKAPNKGRVVFEDDTVAAYLTSPAPGYGEFGAVIRCGELDWRPSSLVQLITLCLPSLSKVEDLYIQSTRPAYWLDVVENSQWLEILHPFTAVRNLDLSERFAKRIVPALQEPVGGRMAEVLPTLQNIIFEGNEPSGSIQEAIGQFSAARQVSNISSHSVAVIHRPYFFLS